MKTLLLGWLLLVGIAYGQDNTDVAFRTRYSYAAQNGDTIVGNGTAFAVDLTPWGLKGNHYLMTAAHNTYDDDSKEREHLALELKPNQWADFDVVWVDHDLDIAVIRCKKELPRLAQLAVDDVKPKAHVSLLGCPLGIPVHSYEGTVMKRYAESFKTKVLISFDHGDSGGPLFNQDNQVVGMAVSGFLIPGTYDLDKRYGGFIPVSVLRSFLEEHK